MNLKNIKKTTNYYFDIFIDENDILKISYKVYLCYNNYIIISKDIFNLKSNSMIQDEPKCIIYINNLRKNYYLEKKDESYSIVKSLKFCFNEQVKMYYLQFKELNEEVNQDNQLNIEHTELINRCIETQRILITTKNQEEPNFSLKKSDCKLEVYLNDDLYDKGNSLAIENSVITTVDFSNKDLVAKLFVKFLYNDNDCYLMSYQKNSLNISSSSNGYGVESNIMMINKKDKTYYFTNLESKDIDKKINDALLKKIYGDNYLSLIEDEIKEFNNYIDKLNNTDDLKNSNSDLLEKLKQIEKYEFKDIEKITNYYFDIFIDNNEIIKIDYKVCFNKTNSIIISRNIFNLKSSFEIQNNESQYIFCFNNSYFKREYTSYNIVNPFKFNLNYRVEEEKYLTLNEKNTADIPLNQFFITKYKEISIDPTQIIDKPINTEKSNYILICMIIFILLISSFLIFKKVKDSSINKNEENISIEE